MEPDLASPSTGASASSSASAPLNGTLEDNTPAGVLQVLSSQRETGAVRFSGESGCTVYLHEGELYFAETGETGEDLAIAVVRPGRLTADEWDRSTAAGYPTETVGEELISTGSVTRELLASIVLSIIYDPLIQLFRAPEGDFEFEPNVVHWIGPYRTFGVDAIVAEVRRRTREADEMAPVVPSLDATVHSAHTLPEDRGSVNLRRDDWEVVVAASAGRTVSEIAVELGRGRWSTARLVYRLASVGLLVIEPAAAPAPPSFDDPGNDEPESTGSVWGASTTETAEPSESAWGTPATESPEPWGSSEPEEQASPIGDPDRRLSDGPPPLDASAFASTDDDSAENSHGTTGTNWSSGSWDATNPAVDDAPSEFGTGFDDAPAEGATEAGEDSWGATSVDETAPAETAWATAPSTTDDLGSSGETAAPETTADAGTSAWGTTESTNFTDSEGAEYTFEPPALHPDIAKALAESTYADSATAINAMAARLGAADADGDDDDDDDDWDSGASTGGETDEFWANDAGSGGEAGTPFTWQPAAWDAGVEATPLPQREHVPRDPDDENGPTGSADPEWLENLYTQFMPGDAQAGGKGPNSVEQALGAQPAAAPKNRSLRRLMKAIKRL